MNRRPPISTRTDTLVPVPTLVLSQLPGVAGRLAARAGHRRRDRGAVRLGRDRTASGSGRRGVRPGLQRRDAGGEPAQAGADPAARSEEHTSELQSLMRISYAVFCLKKKKTNNKQINP